MGFFDFLKKRNNESIPEPEEQQKVKRLPDPVKPKESIKPVNLSVSNLLGQANRGSGNAEALKALGDCYYEGLGTDFNAIRCYYWRKKALELDPGWKEGPAKVKHIEGLLNKYEKAVVEMLLPAKEISKFYVYYNDLSCKVSAYYDSNPSELPLDSIKKLKGIYSVSWDFRNLNFSGESIVERLLGQALTRFAWVDRDIPDYLLKPIIIHYDNGDCYEGCMEHGFFSGEGKYTWAKGGCYVGKWYAGMKHGEGYYCLPDGSVYQGSFKFNLMDGEGYYSQANGDSYRGEYKDGLMHGSGVYQWHDGRKYEGNLVNGLQEGYGTFTDSDGTQYIGEWLKGKRHGRGTMKYPDGRMISGVWEHDEYIRSSEKTV